MMPDFIMDGVWIINARRETESSDGVGEFIGLVGGILIGLIVAYAVICIVQYLLNRDVEDKWALALIIPILFLTSFLGWIGGKELERNLSTGDTVYDVMIGDNVSFNDFTEQYEIVEQNGNIYTVKERTNR